MKYKLYTKSNVAWSAMMEGIKLAKKSIYIEMYIFLLDIGGQHDFLSALKERAENGVKIIIVVDARGSSKLKSSIVGELKLAGIEILFFSNWLRRTHRKIFIIDERISFLGGVNIKKSTSNWHDLQIKIDSPLLAKNILRSFSYTYKMSGGKDERLLKTLKNNLFQNFKAQFLEHWPNKNIYTLKKYYSGALMQAEKKIIIVTPYFTPPRWMMALMESAIIRGVQIEVMIPADTDVKFLNRINRAYALRIRNIGLKFFLKKSMNHAKILLVDNKVALIGSQNLDLISFNLNLESSVSIRDKNVIKDLNLIIDQWQNNSTETTLSEEKFSPWDKLLLFLMKFFYPIL